MKFYLFSGFDMKSTKFVTGHHIETIIIQTQVNATRQRIKKSILKSDCCTFLANYVVRRAFSL